MTDKEFEAWRKKQAERNKKSSKVKDVSNVSFETKPKKKDVPNRKGEELDLPKPSSYFKVKK